MTLVNDIRKTVTDTNPVYAAVGVTDLAVEMLRDARNKAAGVRLDREVSALQDNLVKRFEKVAEQAQQIPAQVRNQTVEVAGKARDTYSSLAVRGEALVKRIRNQKSTKDLFAQANTTVAFGKGAVTTVRKAAAETQRAALDTLANGRREVGSIASSVQDDVRATGRKVSKAASSTRSSAEGTATTVKEGAKSAKGASKGVATSAKKTAASGTAATKNATTKIGD
jgi:heparin binding hemagglutinin HbhA